MIKNIVIMKWYLLFFICLAVVCFFCYKPINLNKMNEENLPIIVSEKIKLSSPAFSDGASIPIKYTCDGQGINPPLEISGISQNAKSLVLLMEDPDAPAGTWDHWVKFNIPPDTIVIKENDNNFGASGKGTAENLKYIGPCPPSGTHRYIFKLFSLDTVLKLEAGVKKNLIIEAMQGHIIQETQLIGLYKR